MNVSQSDWLQIVL